MVEELYEVSGQIHDFWGCFSFVLEIYIFKLDEIIFSQYNSSFWIDWSSSQLDLKPGDAERDDHKVELCDASFEISRNS